MLLELIVFPFMESKNWIRLPGLVVGATVAGLGVGAFVAGLEVGAYNKSIQRRILLYSLLLLYLLSLFIPFNLSFSSSLLPLLYRLLSSCLFLSIPILHPPSFIPISYPYFPLPLLYYYSLLLFLIL